MYVFDAYLLYLLLDAPLKRRKGIQLERVIRALFILSLVMMNATCMKCCFHQEVPSSYISQVIYRYVYHTNLSAGAGPKLSVCTLVWW